MNKKKIKYFKIDKLDKSEVKYGFFSRIGGLSSKNYSSLNCNINSKDKKINVIKNINLAKNTLKLKNTKLKFINQTHSAKVEIINERNFRNKTKADGAITKNKNISLAILTADCAPIFIYDTKKTFICAIHCGWKGCFKNIISFAIKKIKLINKTNNNLIAIVGPCLKKNNFEVDIKFKKKFINQNLKYIRFFNKKEKNSKIFFDMRGLINFQLKEMLIKNIYNINKDTYNNSNLFYSHRRTTHKGSLITGRMINIISFNK